MQTNPIVCTVLLTVLCVFTVLPIFFVICQRAYCLALELSVQRLNFSALQSPFHMFDIYPKNTAKQQHKYSQMLILTSTR